MKELSKTYQIGMFNLQEFVKRHIMPNFKIALQSGEKQR